MRKSRSTGFFGASLRGRPRGRFLGSSIGTLTRPSPTLTLLASLGTQYSFREFGLGVHTLHDQLNQLPQGNDLRSVSPRGSPEPGPWPNSLSESEAARAST